MKAWTLASLLFAATASAHTIFQRVSVDGADQGYLVGVRSPSVNNPVYDVTSSSITCNTGLVSPVSTSVINIPAGSKVGAFWQHVLGGPQFSGDPDNPIATSHHGPIQAYLAKVPDSSSAGTTGLNWFKVSSDGLTNGKWGVDNMVANAGWSYFTMPTCIAPGNYLLRVEIIALHNAYNSGGAQFYTSCANINVTGSGSGSFTPSTTVSLPGAYSASDPGILINIYDASGNPTNGGKAYTPPGPAVITCGGGSSPVTSTPSAPSSSSTKPASSSTTSPKPTSSSSSASGGAPLYGQCGGQGWTGATTCASGTCKVSNQYYSQCLP